MGRSAQAVDNGAEGGGLVVAGDDGGELPDVAGPTTLAAASGGKSEKRARPGPHDFLTPRVRSRPPTASVLRRRLALDDYESSGPLRDLAPCRTNITSSTGKARC